MFAGVAFAAPVTTNLNFAQYTVSTVASDDVNGDGIPDLLVGHINGSAQLLTGTKSGVFTQGLQVGPGAQTLALADFTGDGNLDIATAVGVLPGNGNGTFGVTGAGQTYILPTNTVALYAADVNGDGKNDLVAATFTSGASPTDPATVGISVLLGNGNGSFNPPVSTVVGTVAGMSRSFAALAFDDFNNDGKLDLLTAFGVLMGNGDGTFKSPATPLPFRGGALPSAAVVAVGDFNGDGNPDIAVLPPASSPTDSIEILVGKGDGTFSDKGPVSLGNGGTISSLAVADLNGDGNDDLLVGVTLASNASDIAVLLGSGTGTFTAPPQLLPVPGPPMTISTGDFNGDGNIDLFSINAAAGSALGGSNVLIPATASVLLNTAVPPTTPVITIGSSAARVVAGTTFKLTASVQPPAPPPVTAGTVPTPSNSPVPTGVVTFNQGSTTLGTAPLKNGRATLSTAISGVGPQPITATYSGDATYSGGTSSALNVTVLLSSAAAPLLVPALSAAMLPATFIPGDAGTVSITLTNGGGSPAVGTIAANLYLSHSGIIDASAIAISLAALQNRAIAIASGRTSTLTARFVAASYPAGSYKLVAQIVPLSGLTSDALTQATVVSSASFQAAGMVFGTVGAHKGLTLRVADDAGDVAALSIAGAGTGTVTQTSGLTDVTLAGTNTTSQLIVTPISGTFAFDTINVTGSIFGIRAARSGVTGGVTVRGSIGELTLGFAGSDPAGAMPITIGSGQYVNLSLGNVTGVVLNSAAALRSVAANSWQGGSLIAPFVASLVVKGLFDADVQLHAGGRLQTAVLGSVDGGTWSLAGGIGALRVNGDFSNARIYSGADAGADNVLGTSDDRYAVAGIGSVFVGGADTSTLVAAGAAPLPGGNIFAGLTLLPKAFMRSIVVRGPVSADTRFLAATLPARATLDSALVLTSTDPHFSSP